MAWLWSFGGEFFDYEQNRPTFSGNPVHLTALEWIASYADLYGANARTGHGQFVRGESAMVIQSTTRLASFSEDDPDLRWWTSHVPAAPGVARFSLSFVLGPAIPAGAPNPEAAAEFLLYLAQPETQVFWYQRTKSLPTRWEAIREIGSLIIDPREQIMVNQLPISRVVPPLYSEVRGIFLGYLNAMRRKEIAPAQVLENVQREVEPLYRDFFGN